MLAGEEREKVQRIGRTDFVVQFIWIPTLEKDRKTVDPRSLKAGVDEKTDEKVSTPPATP